MKKIIIFSPYFGNLPNTIELTLQTMFGNKNVDWVIFNDTRLYDGKLNNVNFVYMTLDDMCSLITNKLGTHLSSAYKLCDYRPAYGYLFDSYIDGYDFWGYCDLDMIFGQLEHFFSDDILNQYDKIYDLGHLSIYRNDKLVNEAFMGTETYSVPYKDIFNHKYNCIFDENYNDTNGGINQVLRREGFSVYVNRLEIADIDIRFRNFHIHNREDYDDFYFYYNGEKLFLKRYKEKSYCEEVIYAHYQQRKNIPVATNGKTEFLSCPKSFCEVEKLNDSLFYNKNDYSWKKYYTYRLNRFYKKIKAIMWQKFHSDISKYNYKLK